MSIKMKITIGLVLGLCIIAAPGVTLAAASETEEFTPVGGTVTVTGGETAFVFAGLEITCAESSGKGAVASKTQVKVTISFEKCLTVPSKTIKEAGVTITPCIFNIHINSTATLEGGCEVTIKSLACTLALSATENNERETLEFGSLKVGEEEEKEIEPSNSMFMELTELTYKATGLECAIFGIKGGSEGAITTLTTAEAKGTGIRDRRRFNIKLSSPLAPRTVIAESTSTHEFRLENGKKVSCGQVKASNMFPAGLGITELLKVGPTRFASCTTNILGPTEPATVVGSSNCELILSVRLVSQVKMLYPGYAGFNANCGLTAKVGTCEVKLVTGFQNYENWSAMFSNASGTPRTVLVKYPRATRDWIQYRSIGSCNNLGDGFALYIGESKLRAETATGGSAEVWLT
jgi:hypothetical protein